MPSELLKVVSALPDPLQADAVYFVRAGAGFDLYVTNHAGVVVAYTLNVLTPEAIDAAIAGAVQAHAADPEAHGLNLVQASLTRLGVTRVYQQLLVRDRFNRADGPIGAADVGGAWVINLGGLNVAGNKLVSAGGADSGAYLATGWSDVVVSALVNVAGKSGPAGLTLRQVLAAPYDALVLALTPDGILSVQGGGATLGSAILGAPSDWTRLTAVLSGTRISVLVAGDLALDLTSSYALAGMAHGPRLSGTAEMDDYRCTTVEAY